MAENPIEAPRRYREILATFASLSDDEAAAVIAAFRGDEPLLDLDPLVEKVNSSTEAFDSDEATRFVAAIVSLVMTYRPITSSSAIAERLVSSASLRLPDEEREQLAQRVAKLLEAPPLDLTAKTSQLANDHEHLFQSARLFTDIRPVFSDDSAESIEAAVVVGTLKLDYYDAAGEVVSFHLAMSHDDLANLREVLDRGLAKTKSVKSFLQDAQVPYMRDESDGNS